MGEHQVRLAATLRKLWEVADKPALDLTVRSVTDKGGRISTTTISDWMTVGKSAPAKASTAQFMMVVDFFERCAKDKVRGRRRIPEGVWSDLLRNAQEESRAAQRKGRPAGQRSALPGSKVTAFMLPADVPGFTARECDVEELLDLLAPLSGRAVSVINGMPGAGKTALAVHVAHQVRAEDWFPGGVVLMNLRGSAAGKPADQGAVAARLLRVLGVKGADVPASAEDRVLAWQSLLDQLAQCHRALLVILDDVAIAAQVRELLPGLPHRMIITSRYSLSALPARQIEVGPLSPGESAQLLDKALRVARPDDDRVTSLPEDARRLAELCGRLPLALQIVAALLRDDRRYPVAGLARDLADARTRLERLTYDDTDSELRVKAAFDLSYDRLGAAAQRAFRLLAAIPGDDASAGAAAAAFAQSEVDSRRLLAVLARAHLLEQNAAGRWGMHDLIRLYAHDRAREDADADQRDETLSRIFRYYADAAGAAMAWLRLSAATPQHPYPARFESREEAIGWLDNERPGLIAAVSAAHADARWEQTHQFALQLTEYLEFRHLSDDLLTISALAADAGGRLGPRQRFEALTARGLALRLAHRHEESLGFLKQALGLARDDTMRSAALHNLGLAYLNLESYPRAEMCHREDRRLCGLRGDLRGAAQAGVALGDALRARRRYPEAARALAQAIAAFEKLDQRGLGGPTGLMNARINLARTYLQSPRRSRTPAFIISQLCAALASARDLDHLHAKAVIYLNLSTAYRNKCATCHQASECHWAQEAAESYRQLGDLHGQAKAFTALATAKAEAGDTASAIEDLQRAYAITTETAVNDAEQIQKFLHLLTNKKDSFKTPECTACCQDDDSAFLRDWLDDLPHAILRGEDGRLTEVLFVQ